MTMQKYDGGDTAITLGQTHLDAGDFIPPRVKVVQQMSDEAAQETAKPGDLFNTLTGENYGKELSFIPIQPFKQRILLVRSEKRPVMDGLLAEAGLPALGEGDGLRCRSFDMQTGSGDPGLVCADCPLSAWVDNHPPLCTETYNMAALTELGDLIFLGFQKSSAKVGKRLFSMTRLTAGSPWSKTYMVRTHAEKNNLGNFFVPDVTVVGPTVTELLGVARNWAQQLGGMVLDVSGGAEDDEPASGDPAPF
jgi:hypothetical protein